jgi:trk system potassium uptake protein TrkA
LGSNVVGKVVLELALPPECVIFGIYRGGDLELDVDMMEIRVGDSICVAGSEKGLEKFNTFLGVKHKAVEFAILGGSIVGVNVAKMLIHRSDIKRLVTIVEHDPDRCRELTKLIPEALVLKEDFKDPRVQRNEDLFRADCLIVTSGSDDTNLLMSMSASKYNSEKVITRYFKPEYKDIFAYTNLDTIAGFYRIISNEITKCILPDEVALMRMRNYSELFFTVDVMKAPNFRNKFFGDIQIVRIAKVVAIYRNGGIIFPELDTMLLDDDKMVVFTTATNEAELKNTFGKISLPEL